MEIAIALVIGIVLGGVAVYFFTRKNGSDMEALSAKVMQQQTKSILELAESKLAGKKDVIDETLKSMGSNLTRVEGLIKSIGEGNASVKTQLTTTANAIKDLSDTTGGLKSALAGNSIRGQWGERMAEDVLRLAGLLEGINYQKQKRIEGAGSKPDFTFLLPRSLKLNMDVKFPFNKYQQYLEAKTETEKERLKKDFLADVKKRVKEVQTRDYIDPEGGTVDYVLLFIPNEQIFSFINEMDRTIVDEALKGRTILCSPLSLYAILAIIRQSIDSFTLEKTSKQMLEVFGVFKAQWEEYKGKMKTVKDRFDTTLKGFDELVGVRERQLDRPLEKIEEMRNQSQLPAGPITAAIDKAKDRVLTPDMEVELVR